VQVCRGQYSPSPAPRAPPYHIVDYVQAYTHSISIMVSLHPVVLVQSIILDELLNAFHHIHVYIYSIYLFITEYTPHASFRSVESSIHWWNPWFLWLIPSTIRLGPWARSGRCTMHTIGPAQGVAFPWRGEDPWSWKNIGLVAVEYPHICVIT